MDILFTLGRYWPTIGGGELHTRELIRYLSPRHRVRVACLRNDNRTDWIPGMVVDPPPRQQPYFDRDTEVRLLRLGIFRRLRLRKRLEHFYADQVRRTSCGKELAELFLPQLRKIEGALDLVHNVKVGPEFLSLASLRFARERKVPFVFTPISHPGGWEGEIFSLLYREADALIAMTEFERAFLISQGGRPERIHVVGVGPLLESLEPTADARRALSIRGPLVLFLGQKYPYKGVAEMVEAAPLVWASHPDAHFVFAGPRTEQSRALFSAVGDARIIDIDTVSNEEKTNLLAACDILCMPSRCESFGIVYLEAWSFRKPVIAADTDASRCVVEDRRDGLLVAPEPAGIAAAINTLLGDEALRHALGEHGHRKAATTYSWPVIASKVEQAYAQALGGCA
ncbi:MAG TPA: glycosyltransferase family 4 protein [bacterium]|nr:glycosyltransferase family 4 protein [Chlamydiota bacterium]HOE27558.1 glycosyltransferase family 4 protein [bacterium]HQM52505.1 glycosyltransferase family 4 protein [bacterium]